MSADGSFDRLLAAWLTATAPETAPGDLVDSIAATTAVTPRRPAWRSPGWSLPATWTARAPSLAAAFLVVLAVLAMVAGLVLIGSRPRVPPPFGPARPGLVVFASDGILYAAPPDGSGVLQLTSGPSWDANPVFSLDGTWLAFWSRPAGSHVADLVVMRPDGSGRHSVARGTFSLDFGQDIDGPRVAWSPDGRSIAYSAEENGIPRIFVAHSDGSGVTVIGDPRIGGGAPAWSPDGSLIAFSGGRNDEARGLYVMRADGTETRRLSHAAGNADMFEADWSPDGTRLAYAAGYWGKTSIWTVGVDGSDERRIDEWPAEAGPAWSPDGRRLAWVRAVSQGSSHGSYVIADPDGTNPIILGDDAIARWAPSDRATTDGCPAVAWSTDGSHLIGTLSSRGSGQVVRLIAFPVAGGPPTIIETAGMLAWDQQRLAP